MQAKGYSYLAFEHSCSSGRGLRALPAGHPDLQTNRLFGMMIARGGRRCDARRNAGPCEVSEAQPIHDRIAVDSLLQILQRQSRRLSCCTEIESNLRA